MDQTLTMPITDALGVSAAKNLGKQLAREIGFPDTASEEIALVLSELGSNLWKHAGRGNLTIQKCVKKDREGIQIESKDRGPGIRDIERAIGDGFSTRGSLGYGLGSVHRLMDEVEITSPAESGKGVHLVCRRWLPPRKTVGETIPLDIGGASRAHPAMSVNGDAMLIRKWEDKALVVVIDGLGHGQFAHRAAETARSFIDRHFEQPLENLFRNVSRQCRTTRGIVMSAVRIEWAKQTFQMANIGNIAIRVHGSGEPVHFLVRRGILGAGAPPPKVSTHPWFPGMRILLHSDGVSSRWRWEEMTGLAREPANRMAQKMLRKLAKDNDDATIALIKEKPGNPSAPDFGATSTSLPQNRIDRQTRRGE